MWVLVGFRSWLPRRYRWVGLDGDWAHVVDLTSWLYRNVMGGEVARRGVAGGGVQLCSAATGPYEATEDGQPRDCQLLDAFIDGQAVAPWGIVLDGQTVVFRRRPYELSPLPPFSAQPEPVGDVRNIRAFCKRQEMEAVWQLRHGRAMRRKEQQPRAGTVRRQIARGIPQIDLRPAVTDEEKRTALVNPIGGVLVVLKNQAEKEADVRAGRHLRYNPAT